PASGSLLIRDVEVQAAACCYRVDQGLQLWWRGRLGPCWPPALQGDPGGEPGTYRAQCPGPGRGWRREGGARPPPPPGRPLGGRLLAAVPPDRAGAGDRRTRRPSRR